MKIIANKKYKKKKKSSLKWKKDRKDNEKKYIYGNKYLDFISYFQFFLLTNEII